MLKITKKSKANILDSIQKGEIDAVDISNPNFIDEIILKMHENGVIDELEELVKDKRHQNTTVPLKLIWTLAIAAKMKIHTSLSDVPFGITDAQTLSKLGVAIWDTNQNLEKGLFDEGTVRHLLGKYDKNELVSGYNNCIQDHILTKFDLSPNIHILDCTDIYVEISNENYEESSIVRYENENYRGYKLATLRGLIKDNGIIEEVRFGTLKTHDLNLSREMILTSKMLKKGDILINDRGFLSRDVINSLKLDRQVDVYVPLKKNMDIYKEAVKIANLQNNWKSHPNKKRKTQKITTVTDLGSFWQSKNPENDVQINACVVKDKKDGKFRVFITTDTSKTAREIIKTYELRWEIEEDYRQLKDFWMLDDFKSTKINMITFHIVCTLLGYAMYQIFLTTTEGKAYSGKSLPVLIKKYRVKKPKSVIIYAGEFFAIFAFLDFLHLYSKAPPGIKEKLDKVLEMV
jgi:hypothetical protein